ncbi:hypothetical protein HDU67_009840 [Dinochytrium kinnereticum]|nr:hypothetical protein HDU67_009840 [Dinochytrium kinnereticum]
MEFLKKDDEGRYYEDNYGLLTSLWTTVLVMLIVTALMHIAAMIANAMGNAEEAYGPLEGGDVQPLLGGGRRGRGEGGGTWTDRFKRATDTALRALLLLLTIAIFLSIPIGYPCRESEDFPRRLVSKIMDRDDDDRPRPPIPIPPKCTVCISNAVTLSSTILAWILLAMSVLWAILDAVAPVVGGMGALIGSVMGLARSSFFPFLAECIVAVGVVGYTGVPVPASAMDRSTHNFNRNVDQMAAEANRLISPPQPVPVPVYVQPGQQPQQYIYVQPSPYPPSHQNLLGTQLGNLVTNTSQSVNRLLGGQSYPSSAQIVYVGPNGAPLQPVMYQYPGGMQPAYIPQQPTQPLQPHRREPQAPSGQEKQPIMEPTPVSSPQLQPPVLINAGRTPSQNSSRREQGLQGSGFSIRQQIQASASAMKKHIQAAAGRSGSKASLAPPSPSAAQPLDNGQQGSSAGGSQSTSVNGASTPQDAPPAYTSK